MTDTQIKLCESATKLLRSSDEDHPKRSVRLKYADQIEMQMLVGNSIYDEAAVNLSVDIIHAFICSKK